MAYTVPSGFPELASAGLRDFAPYNVLGQSEELVALREAQHYLWACGCRRRILSQRFLEPIVVVGGPTQVLELTATMQAGRYNLGGGAVQLFAYVDYEGGNATVEITNAAASFSSSSTTANSTPRAQATLSFATVSTADLLVKVSLTQVGGSGAKLHGVMVYEAKLGAANLAAVGDFVPRDDSTTDAGRSWNALETSQAYVNLLECNNERTPSGAWGYHLDRPLNLASLTERVMEFPIPLWPELGTLGWTITKKVEDAAVSLRWSLVWQGGQTQPGSWTSYSTTGGSYNTATGSLDLSPALRAGATRAIVRLHVLSAEYGAGKAYPTLAANGVSIYAATLSAALSATFPGIDALFAAKVEFETGGGTALPLDEAREVLRWTSGGTTYLYFYPPLADYEATDLFTTAGRLAVTPLGRMLVKSFEFRYSTSAPYVGASAFPWSDAALARRALTSGQPVSAQAHQQLYGAARYLAAGRVPILGLGQQPGLYSDTGGAIAGASPLRGQGYFAVSTYTGPRTVWGDLGAWVFDSPDTVEYQGSTLNRRAVEVMALLFASGSPPAGELPVEVRLVWRTASGTVRATSATVVVTLPVNLGARDYLRVVFSTRHFTVSNYGPSDLATLQPLMPVQLAGSRVIPVHITLADLDAGHSAGDVLALQVRPEQNLPTNGVGGTFTYVYLQGAYLCPLRGAAVLDSAI